MQRGIYERAWKSFVFFGEVLSSLGKGTSLLKNVARYLRALGITLKEMETSVVQRLQSNRAPNFYALHLKMQTVQEWGLIWNLQK